MRVVFAGTPEFAVPALEALVNSTHDVVAVYCQPDRPAGRGRKVRSGPVKACADTHKIPVVQPTGLRDEASQATLSALKPDVMVVVAYGILLPAEVLAIPRLGCVNIHGSLLPRWRGAAPLHRAILAGDSATGITIMQMDEGLDTGPMLSSRDTAITPETTSASLHDVLAGIGAELLLETLEPWCLGQIEPQTQNAQQASYAAKLEKQEAIIDWSAPALAIDRQIRAFNPWPVAETVLQGERLRIWRSRVPTSVELKERQITSSSDDQMPGQIILCRREGFWVRTGEGVMAIEELQLPGKRAMAYLDFVNSRDVTGIVLGSPEENRTAS